MSQNAHSDAKTSHASRYDLLVEIASGGMGTVYVARARGALGFQNIVAVKKPHEYLFEAPSFRRTLLEEARISSQIRHANVIAIKDVALEEEDRVFLIMDYVEGASLAALTDSEKSP